MSAPLELAKLLNPAQLEAVITTEGPLLVLAGAGSGKTRVLVHRVAHLVESSLARPYEILAVTFTNKAAQEMKTRLEKLVPGGVRDAWIGTFHSIAGRILRREGMRLGYAPNFSIYDTDDQRRALKRVMQDLGMDPEERGASLQAIATEIDRAKNHGLTPRDMELSNKGGYAIPAQIAARRVYGRYQQHLRQSNAMDFGDLLLLAVEVLRHHPEARARFARRFRYVMVDEFQDTNRVQYELLRLLVEEHQNLMVVGDDDQAIYRWRGAEVANILEFPRAYPQAKVVKLEENYRSTGLILEAANAIIKKNSRRHGKMLRTEAGAGLPLGIALVNHGDEEAYLVAQTIAARVAGGDSASDFAILYRQNAQSRAFEDALRRARVSFTIVGGTGFYERREVKDVLAYLRLVANPASMEDLERIINVPARKLGDVTVEKLRRAGEAAGVSGAHILLLPEAQLRAVDLSGKTLEKIRELGQLLAALVELARTAPAEEVARTLIERIGYLKYLHASDEASGDDREANVKELVNTIAEREADYRAEADGVDGDGEEGFGLASARTPLEAFLDDASLVSPNDTTSSPEAVTLLTIHAAKGLEFPVVFLVGMEEQTFPSRRAVEGDVEDLEEERRLCYVAVTRAMRELNLLAARFRRIYGSEEVRRPSRFLGDLPDSVVTTFGSPSGGSRGGGGGGGGRGTIRSEPRRGTRDDVVYDDDGFSASEPVARIADDDGFRVGDRVFHNTFEHGVVESVSGTGPQAHLTVRFPTEGVRRVVARFVRRAK